MAQQKLFFYAYIALLLTYALHVNCEEMDDNNNNNGTDIDPTPTPTTDSYGVGVQATAFGALFSLLLALV
uniref:Uncharacterized protein n=1 Tax=Tetraselmis sp. GSL018 TaxID=582737 RepID=A0A061S6P6_9CHLO|eukprot:CAMPEP_0177602018 /NCGR_PEP_ID=MMETSP0419_2-20121207/14622_1 /TAXON_ID=582737 /ORGANISM="Tetraselmis sp., Strain GSL018" /LENGTH=69 /DNA_ID=CAMNT_0019095429 /DNA_START=134 /DNA_END=343 /DNA_ORIENTATION=-